MADNTGARPGGPLRFLAGPNAWLVAALSAALITLVAGAVIGGRSADSSAAVEDLTGRGGPSTGLPDYSDFDDVDPSDPDSPTTDVPGATAGPGRTARPGSGGAGTGGGGGGGELPSQPGATRVGVTNQVVEVGVHAPLTFDGQPLNLADDPITGLKGYVTYVNRNGGVNGRKIQLYIEDDRYTTQGGQQAADRLVKEIKPFLISGTLGIDQIEKVALASKQAGIPYMAGGGPEPEARNLMFQIISNYDQYANMIVDFICTYGKEYVGENEVRLGTTTLDSHLILPVEERFVRKLEERRCVVTPVDGDARGTIIKPTEQTTYQDQLLRMRNSYNGRGVNLIVPFQDPISTSRQVAENRPYRGPSYNPRWTYANFAHDSDTVQQLMGGDWTGVRGMSGGCYYHPSGNPNAYNPGLCARMKDAHEQWVSLGQVTFDENAGGDAGGRSSYNYNESSWEGDGSGGSAGYQLVYFWHGALKSIGPDPTREKFVSALMGYDGYSNLVTGPISFKGTSNTMIGATKFVLLEGRSNLKNRQVTEITPGLVDQF